MAKRKTEAALEKMQPDMEAVKAEERPPEEKPTGEPWVEKTEESSPKEQPTGESGAEKAEEPSPEEKAAEESGAEKAEELSPEEKAAEESGAEKAEELSPEEKAAEKSGAEKVKEPSTKKQTFEEPEECIPAIYKIVCRNKITKRIGGVDFMDGEGYTLDGYAASWFAAKDGYTVEQVEQEQLW